MIDPEPATGYVHDVFLSYPRNSFVEEWVRELLFRALQDELSHIHPDRPPQIFIDERIRTGEHWPDSLRHALLTSRCMVAVWSAQYFRSRWCMAEWRSMHTRAAMTGSRLVLPLIVRDGDSFHADAKVTQARDFNSICNRPDAIRNTHPDALRFYREVQSFAEDDVLPAILGAPPWSADFPIETPEPVQPVFALRRLRG